MTFTCRPRNQPCLDDVCRSMNDCAWPPDDESTGVFEGAEWNDYNGMGTGGQRDN